MHSYRLELKRKNSVMRIVISNMKFYHTPYQVKALLDRDDDNEIRYYSGVRARKLNEIFEKKHMCDIQNLSIYTFLSLAYGKICGNFNSQFELMAYTYFSEAVSKQIGDNIDIFQAFNGSGRECFSKLKKFGGTKIISECGIHPRFYNDIAHEESEKYGLKEVLLPQWYVERSEEEFEMSDYILTQSEICVNSFLKNGVPGDKIIKLPIGANLDSYFIGAECERHFFTQGILKILFVGRATVLKGTHLLIEACERLKRSGINIECTVAGPISDAYIKKLALKCEDSQTIRFVGKKTTEELKKLYHEADVMVLPSLMDSTAMVVYESMACGTPVIVSENVGAEVRDGFDGYVIQTGSVEAICNKLSFLNEHPDKLYELSRNSLKGVCSKTWREYSDKLVEIYDDILRKK